jgi:hypothetical protein
MKKYFCLLALYSCIEAHASEPSLTFPEQKIELPSLSLWGSTPQTPFSSPTREFPSWFKNPETDREQISPPANGRPKRPTISADRFIITPNDNVDYKLVVKEPDPDIDYKLIVKDVESTRQK